MNTQAPIQLPLLSDGMSTDQAWVGFFDDTGRALEGVWSDIPDNQPSISGASADSVQVQCVVRGTMGWLFLDLEGYTGGGTYEAPITFGGTFSQIRDKSSGTLAGLTVSGSTVDLPAVAGDYQVQIYAPVILDQKLAKR